MRKLTAIGAASAALLFIFVLGGVHHDVRASSPTASWLPVAAAEAAPGVCPVPSLSEVAGDWVVRSAKCTNGACKRAHLAVGDRVRFQRDVSGEANFSVDFVPSATKRRAQTDGYTLRSDGVAGLKGPIVLDHDPLDGSPLDLHWLIVQIRSYDSDGFGTCKLTGLIQVCESEPAAGASECGAQQHGGSIVVGPP